MANDTGTVSRIFHPVCYPVADSSYSSLASEGIALYYTQLALNVIWSPLFFLRKQVRKLTPWRTQANHDFVQTELALFDCTLLTTATIWMTVRTPRLSYPHTCPDLDINPDGSASTDGREIKLVFIALLCLAFVCHILERWRSIFKPWQSTAKGGLGHSGTQEIVSILAGSCHVSSANMYSTTGERIDDRYNLQTAYL